MKVVVTGASGLIGSALVPALQAAGHEVRTLVRRPPEGPGQIRWDPDTGMLDAAELAGIDAAVHLAGAGVGDHRWTDSYKATILDSRVRGTTLLSRSLAALEPRPAVLLSASAVGWYGNTRDEAVTESATRGEGFLAGVVEQWEASTRAARDAGIRVCHLRSGVVLSGSGGALKLQLPIFKLGLGGRINSGRQYLSWISRNDEVRAILFLLGADAVSGPVNLVGPGPVTNREFTKALGHELHRPAPFVVPGLAVRVLLGGFGKEGVEWGQRVVPAVLQGAGFTFEQPTLEDGLDAALAPGG